MSVLYQKVSDLLQWVEESVGKHTVFSIISIIIITVHNTFIICIYEKKINSTRKRYSFTLRENHYIFIEYFSVHIRNFN